MNAEIARGAKAIDRGNTLGIEDLGGCCADRGGPPNPIKTLLLCLALAWLIIFPAEAADSFTWRTNQNLVSADIQYRPLGRLLEQITAATGWKVFVEPGTTHDVSAKFKDLPPGQALRLLLGDLNFALVPETNASPKLFVFRTAQRNATELVRAPASANARGKIIANELIVRLKPGAKIDELARSLGAKVIGRIGDLNAYRLQFDSADAATAAREQLATNPDVSAVDNNYSIDRPPIPQGGSSTGVPPPHLQLNPPPSNGRVVVGLIDTAVQPLGNDLDRFMLKSLSVAGDAQLGSDTPTHGTSMAETILRSLEMMTKGSTAVQILPVDVYGPNASTSTFDVASGITQAINGGANVLNLSLGSEGDSPFLRDLIKDAIAKKIAFFAAAGNEPVTTPFYPAAYSDLGLFAVTATTGTFPATGASQPPSLAPYANRGTFITLAAPGTSFVSFNGQQWYAVGTSSATAVASGMAAGYMDSTHSSMDKMQSFINSTFGVKVIPGK